MSDIQLVGLASNDPFPGNFIEVDFNQGASAGFQGAYKAILIGGMLAAGNVHAAAPAGLFAAVPTVAAPVTVLAAAMLSPGKAAILLYPSPITITVGGTTPANAPASAVITGTDIDGTSISETVTIAGVAGLTTSTKIYATVVSVVYAAAGGTAATVAIGYAASPYVTQGLATPDTVIYGPDTPTVAAVEADVIGLFGAGSELHRMWRRFTAINKTTPVYLLAVSEGTSPTAASTTITVGGVTSALASGVLRIWVGDTFCDAGFSVGDSPTTIAGNAQIALDAMVATPIFAVESAGVLTLTALQRGPRGNFVRVFAQVISNSPTGITVTPSTSTALSGGASSDSNATALTTLVSQNFYYIVSAAEDATQVGALVTQVASQALPVTGIRQSVYAASVDTVANGIAITTGINAVRLEIPWLYQSDMPPCEFAANNAAVYALFEAGNAPLLNFNKFGQDPTTQAAWVVKAPLSGAAPTRAQMVAALNAGLSPVAVGPSGTTYLVKRVTTRFLTGSVVDYRARPPHKRLLADRYANDLVTKQATQFAGCTIANDPVGNGPVPGKRTATPRVMKACVNGLTDVYDGNGWLENTPDIKAGTVCVRETIPSTRLSTSIPLQIVELLDQTATLVAVA